MSPIEGAGVLAPGAAFAAVIAAFATRKGGLVARTVLLALAASFGLVFATVGVAGIAGGERVEGPALLLLGLFWLAMVALGAFLGMREPRPRPARVLALLVGLPLAVALACLATGSTQDRLTARAAKLRAHEQAVQLQQSVERRLKACAATLTPTLGRADALASRRRGDARLISLASYGQEASREEVPGLEVRSFSCTGGICDSSYAIGAPAHGAPVSLYAIRRSPKGELWSDPWGRLVRAGAGPPPSGPACDRASRGYALGYNQAMLAGDR